MFAIIFTIFSVECAYAMGGQDTERAATGGFNGGVSRAALQSLSSINSIDSNASSMESDTSGEEYNQEPISCWKRIFCCCCAPKKITSAVQPEPSVSHGVNSVFSGQGARNAAHIRSLSYNSNGVQASPAKSSNNTQHTASGSCECVDCK